MSNYVMTRDPVPCEYLPSWMKTERTRILTREELPLSPEGKSVIYWMQRDVRTVDNWALLFASHVAETQKLPLYVFHVLNPPASTPDGEIPTLETMGTTERHGKFLLGGLQLVHQELKDKGVPLHVLRPQSHDQVATLFEDCIIRDLSPAAVVCDFHAVRHYRQWMEVGAKESCEKSRVPMWQVDAHNVVPVWHAADKRQVGARTLRPRIQKVVQEYLQKFPKFKGNEHCDDKPNLPDFDYQGCQDFLKWDSSVKEVASMPPGTDAAKKQFENFLGGGLAKFHELRNDPNYNTICSNLSPWLNHGHISFQRCMMAVKKLNTHAGGSAAYIEEGLIRRELSDNFLYYTPEDYDKLSGTAEWAQETLNLHSSDQREYLYSLGELENGETHDDLWNAAQLQVVREGRMHGFLRMYWAKKILEWTESPEIALKTAQYFNDKYALDGRDPNGFVGVGWSIMGIHDQGWKEREIFGKIRYMNYNGCKRKFKVSDFVGKYQGAAENAAKAEANHSATKQSTNKRKEPSK
jgi:deoxyribodipyrimidine photo-lyase